MQCGPSHVQYGCNVDPPHLHNLNVDVMWSNVDVLWSNVDFHISNVNKCIYIACQNNGDLRSFLDKYELYVDHHTLNVDPPHLHILTMWIHHISTSPQCGVSTPTHLLFDLYPLSNQSLVDLSIGLRINFWCMIVKDFWSYDSILVLLWKYIK